MNFDKKVNRYHTYCTQWDYIQDRFGRSDLLPFTISDMDFEIPEEMVNCLLKRVNHKVFGYSRWNHDDYKDAIVHWYQKRFDTTIEKDSIVYSPSVIYSVSKFIELKSKKGDKILLNTPAYDGFFKTIYANEREIVESPLEFIDGEYRINFDDFEEKCKECRIFLFCSPHNPVGKVWSVEEIQTIINICKKYNVYIISDEIHMDFVYEKQHIPILKFDDYRENMMICTSASKTFNIPSLIGSYVLIYNDKDREAFLTIMKERDAVASASIMNVLATITAYNECGYFVDELKKYIYNNMIYTKKYITEQIPELEFTIPDGSYFAWINYSKLQISSSEFQQYLVDIGEVAIMSGDTYGAAGAGYLRLNLGCSLAKVQDGLHRLKKTVDYIKTKN